MRGVGLSGPPLLKVTLALDKRDYRLCVECVGQIENQPEGAHLVRRRTYHMSPSYASSSSESGSIQRSFQRMPPSSQPPHTI